MGFQRKPRKAAAFHFSSAIEMARVEWLTLERRSMQVESMSLEVVVFERKMLFAKNNKSRREVSQLSKMLVVEMIGVDEMRRCGCCTACRIFGSAGGILYV